MWRALVVVAMVGCYGGERYGSGCPYGETCSPGTPTGLRFLPPPMFDMQPVIGPTAIAIGGTEAVQLLYGGDLFDPSRPLDLPYTADDGGGPAVLVAGAYGATVTLRGATPGDNELRILDASDGTLFDRESYAAAALARVELASLVTEQLQPVQPQLYAVGLRKLGIRLFDATDTRLYDTSLQLAGAVGLEWDIAEVDAAAAGTYTLGITAGGTTASFDLAIADHADAIVELFGLTSVLPYGSDACFGAQLAGQRVIGFAWSFTVDGVATAAETYAPDCVLVAPKPGATSVVVQATAGGLTTTLTLPVM